MHFPTVRSIQLQLAGSLGRVDIDRARLSFCAVISRSEPDVSFFLLVVSLPSFGRKERKRKEKLGAALLPWTAVSSLSLPRPFRAFEWAAQIAARLTRPRCRVNLEIFRGSHLGEDGSTGRRSEQIR